MVLAAGDVVPFAAVVVLRQQKLHLCFEVFPDRFGFAVLDDPAADDVFDSVVILVAAGRHQAIAYKRRQVDRNFITMRIKQRRIGEVRLHRQPFIAKSQIKRGLQQRSDGRVLVNRQPNGSQPCVTLPDHGPPGFFS